MFFKERKNNLIFVASLVLVTFLFTYGFKHSLIKKEVSIQYYIQVQQEEKERQVVEGKVKYIMSLYNCDSLTIYESIMETFDPILVATLVAIESNYKPEAISPAGALGLCQVMPFHFRSSDNWKDPKANIGVGSNYLKQLMKQFKGDKELALAAFNAGPNAVIKARYKVPSNRGNETKNYVSRAKKINQLVSR